MVDDPDRFTESMDLEKHNFDAAKQDSCLNAMNPIKVFSIRDAELIATLE